MKQLPAIKDHSDFVAFEEFLQGHESARPSETLEMIIKRFPQISSLVNRMDEQLEAANKERDRLQDQIIDLKYRLMLSSAESIVRAIKL